MTRKTLKTYFTSTYKPLNGRVVHGGSVFPPSVTLESNVRVRCPLDQGKVLSMAACRLETHTQFGQEQLLFHGTADPDSAFSPGPNQDHLRWYAFEANMSLDYIREETESRSKRNLPIRPTLYVYKIKKPIRNLLLFADHKKWMDLGGAQSLFEGGICDVSFNASPEEVNAMKRRSIELGAPLDEYRRAVGVSQLRFMRGDRGEHANGWVRINSLGVLGSQMVASKGFEFMFTHPDHSQFLELVGTYDVVDDSSAYGTVASYVEDASSELEWHMAAFSPTPKPPSRRKSIGDASPAIRKRLSL